MLTSAAGSYLLITQSEVMKSLEEHQAIWRAKIETLGRPRLLYDKSGLATLKKRLLTGNRSPELTAFLAYAHDKANELPQPYFDPEEYKKRGQIQTEEELWMRDVGNNITAIAIAQALEPAAELQRALHEGVIALCKYPTWGQKPGDTNMDLACGHAARAVAIAWDWFPELWSEEERQLILKTVTERANVLLAGLYGKAFWAGDYPHNHNEVSCNGLAWCGLAFYTDLPQAPEWLAAARLNFQNVARYFPTDGSSEEGVPYWSYGMSYILQYIEGTRGVIDSGELYNAFFLRNAADFRLNASTCDLGGVLPWGDAPLRDFYGPQHILNRLAVEYKDPAAAWLAHSIPWPPEWGEDVLAWQALWLSDAGSKPKLPLDYHIPNIDIVTTRSGWGAGNYLLSIKSGFCNRSHSHLDIGALALAIDSDWLLTAPGFGWGKASRDYWDAKNKRWTFFANATEAESTLLINGQNQRHEATTRGTIDEFFGTPNWCWTGINMTDAYQDVTSVRRSVLHRRGDYILVFDGVVSKKAATVEWLAQLASEPQQKDNSLIVTGKIGQLGLEMLSPALPFTARHPTSLHVDIPGPFSTQGIHTYAVKTSGETVNFIALLQPRASQTPLPALRAKVIEEKTGLVQIVVDGAGWTDYILKADTSGNREKTAAVIGEIPVVKSISKLTVVRIKGQKVDACVAIGATELKVPDIEIKTASPTMLGLQIQPDGSWELEADQDVQKQIQSVGYSVKSLEKYQNTFRWLLSR